MRCSTLILSVTLFYSLSFVNAIPHDVDEKRHWLHRRQGLPDSSPAVPSPSHSGDPQSQSSPVVSSTPSPSTPRPTSRPSSSSTSRPPSSTPPPPSESPSSTISSPSSSTSPSSSSSSSSTRSSTSTSSRSTTTNRPDTQESTSYRRFSSTRGLPSDTPSAEGNVQTGTGSGSSFLKNKAAMGSTFAIVGLVGVALIVGAVLFLIKKARKRREEDELDTYFEKFPANNNNTASNQNSGGNDYGLGPSATDLTSPTSHQAYMSRDVHYGATSQYPDQYPNYNGFEYPPDRGSVIERPASYAPGTAYAAAMSQRGQYHYEGQVEDPNTVPNHPFADPDNKRY